MSAPRSIAILGAGFSGLTLAWLLRKISDIPIDIFEKENRVGGLISTSRERFQVESAANAILSNAVAEELFSDLGLEIESAGAVSSARWIFRNGKPRKWPLSFMESVQMGARMTSSLVGQKLSVLEGESVAQWTRRCLGSAALDFLVEPVLEGIYATNANDLSAELLLNRRGRPPRGRRKGSVAPTQGMGAITEALRDWLKAKNVKINLAKIAVLDELVDRYDVIVIATGLSAAVQLLKSAVVNEGDALADVPCMGVTSTFLGFSESRRRTRGFGCLFPRTENFHSRGVLFSTDIFSNRGHGFGETWILNDEVEAITKLSDEEVLQRVLEDRRKAFALSETPSFVKVRKWPNAIPCYGPQLKKFLDQPRELRIRQTAIHLTGNYLGALGLGKILIQNRELVKEILKTT